MDSSKFRGDRAAPSPDTAGIVRNPPEDAGAENTGARILPLRRTAPSGAPQTPDDDPGPQAA